MMNIRNTTEMEANPLYIRMRQRFDFSGNRTVGEFMTMKAIRDGYQQNDKKAASARTKARGIFRGKQAMVSAFALLVSCILFVFCAFQIVGAILPDSADSATPEPVIVKVNTLTDASVVEIVFPTDSSDTTME
jgi:hypothetical protein